MRSRFVAGLLIAVSLAACGGAGQSSDVTTPSGPPSSPVATDEPTADQSLEATTSPEAGLQLVAVGDSIPFNSRDDCPGCTSFVDRYAEAVETATGEPVTVRNLSEHNNQTVNGLANLLENDATRIGALSNADVIVVGIAHNDVPMNRDDDACDGPASEEPDWSMFTDECIATEIERFTPQYEGVFERIATLRDGKPTILRTINRYNDWIGWPQHPPPEEGIEATAKIVAAWNEMICGAAEANGFACADVSTAFNGPDGLQPAGDLVAADYTHPSDKGNEVIAEALTELGFEPLAP